MLSQKKKMKETDIGRQPNLRDDPLSDCRSFGSNCHPSSQSRKISIGVMVDSPAGSSRGTKELKSVVPNSEVRFVSLKEVLSDKEVIEDKANKIENRRTEILKMKLWEILGTVSSPNGQHSKCQLHGQDANPLRTEQMFVQTHDRAVRFRQNSDTIETDSEGPDLTMRRPIVRSIMRKRSRTTVQSSKTKTPSCNKLKHQEGNISVFERWPGSTHAAANEVSSMFTGKKREKRSFDFQPCKISFPEKDDGTGIIPKPAGIETLAPGDKPSTIREVLGFHSTPSKHDKGFLRTDVNDEKKEFNQLPQQTNKTQLPGDFNCPADFDQQEDIDNSFLRRDVDPQTHIESPTFRMKTPVCCSPSLTSKTDKIVYDFASPWPAEEMFVTRDICSFWKLQTSEEYCNRSNAKPHSSVSLDIDKEIEESPPRKAATSSTERIADWDLSASSSEETSSESSVEVSSQRDTSSPEMGAVKMLKAILHPAKRARSQESHEFNCIRPGESSWTEEFLVQNQEDGLARAVKLLLSELEKLKNKITSISIEKSSEILLSVAESIHLHLQNVDSQIQMDMVKLLSLGKSRRKILETRFEVQQEQLKYIHKKFKEEVNQHLQNCRSSLQELEAQQIEFEGIMEEQKASHRDTLLQVEEAVDMQLADAQRRIEATREWRIGKMLQLKNVIAMCLK